MPARLLDIAVAVANNRAALHALFMLAMSDADAYVYALGRARGCLEDPFRAEDRVFAAVRLDDQNLADANYRHCTFSNVSFKSATIEGGTFLDCVFIGCYFRRATLTNTSFVGCRFIDCHFGHVAIRGARFPYSLFHGCQVPIDEILFSLPSEPNIREALARNLAIESRRLGLPVEARRYRVEEIRARENHFRAAVAGRSQWYRDHFDTSMRVRALLQLACSWLNRWLWGYGERAWRLLGNVLLLTLILFPAAFYSCRDGLVATGGETISVGDVVRFSVDNMLPVAFASGVTAISPVNQVMAVVESLFGLLSLALFASHIFRWNLRR